MNELALKYYIVYALLMTGISVYSIRLFKSRNYLINTSTTPRIVLFIVLLLLTVFCATGDYWSYRAWYDYGLENLHFEPMWETVRSIIPWGFDIFKLVLWGGGLLLFTIMCKWHKSDLLISYSLFALFYMINYSYARASIAYMLILFAYYLIIKSKEVYFLYLPLLLLLVSFCVWIGIQMHRSMILLSIILVGSLLIPARKKTFILLLLLFPIVSVIFNTILYPYIILYINNDAEMARLMYVYLHEDTRGITVFWVQLFNHLPILLLFFVSLINILRKEDLPLAIKRIAFSSFLIVYFSFIFYSIREGNGLALFYRTMNMAYPFMIMSIAYSMKYINTMSHITLVVIVYKVAFTLLVMYQILTNPQYLYNQVFERYF